MNPICPSCEVKMIFYGKSEDERTKHYQCPECHGMTSVSKNQIPEKLEKEEEII